MPIAMSDTSSKIRKNTNRIAPAKTMIMSGTGS